MHPYIGSAPTRSYTSNAMHTSICAGCYYKLVVRSSCGISRCDVGVAVSVAVAGVASASVDIHPRATAAAARVEEKAIAIVVALLAAKLVQRLHQQWLPPQQSNSSNRGVDSSYSSGIRSTSSTRIFVRVSNTDSDSSITRLPMPVTPVQLQRTWPPCVR